MPATFAAPKEIWAIYQNGAVERFNKGAEVPLFINEGSVEILATLGSAEACSAAYKLWRQIKSMENDFMSGGNND